jgi:hypothetical protein
MNEAAHSSLRRRRSIGWVALGVGLAGIACLALPSLGGAFTLKSLIMPGKVIAAHASIEDQCESCHESDDTQKQSELCYVCHKDIRGDLVSKSGLHGRDPEIARAVAAGAGGAQCSGCHTEHDGRDANITGLDPKTFEHMHTNFPLLGAHGGAACTGCHTAGTPYRAAPQQCGGCHASDDPHNGTLGATCEGCHTSTAWKQAEFDHAKTGFALAGAHGKAVCADCHQNQQFAGAAPQCVACHQSDDKHAGRNGVECGGCHAPTAWAVEFDHATVAGFRLAGKHQQLACEGCHTKNLAAALPRTCVGCHQQDDPHQSKLGTSCGDCHGATRWPVTTFDHAKASSFALSGAHSELACTTCHAQGVGTALGKQCTSCHADTDPHRGQLGAQCQSCHADTGWLAAVRFDHGLAPFPLLGKHSALACADCHASAAFHDTGGTCTDCHASDDPHQGRFAAQCSTCHNPSGWQAWLFDHDKQTPFALTGAHRTVACDTCHRTAGNERVAAVSAARNDCAQCHRRNDPHQGQFGADCGSCHSTDSFSDLRGR